MTALAGVWRYDGRPDAAEACSRILASQEIYGPHAGAQWSDKGVALGRRLMRLLPEDNFDRQPLIGGGGRYVLIADLRLDNRAELAEALNISPSAARTLSDAAFLLAAIERWEETCFDHLLGNYAFALWDGAKRRLHLARDPLGSRPLHYHRGPGFFAFATMPKGLHALADIPYAPDEERIAEYLARVPDSGSRTFFQGIERVEPAHVVTISADGLTARRHWQPAHRTIVFRRPDDYADALREHLDRAVECRLRGAGDVGAHLSGGLDSSAVAATAARLLAPAGRKVFAFTAVIREGYDGPQPRNRFIDEGPHAAATAALYPNMEHVLVRSDHRSPLDDLDRQFYLRDRPLHNLCNIGWMSSINDAAKERKLKVVLSGALGNHGLSFEGLVLLPELLSEGRWLHLWHEARALIARRRMSWRGVALRTFGPWLPASLWLQIHKLAKKGRPGFARASGINPARYTELGLEERMRRAGLDPLSRPSKDRFARRLLALSRNDQGNYHKSVLGGWQIDERDPTADIRLLEYCFAVPTEQFLSNGVSRALARRALADRLPEVVLNETGKGLQAADWHESLTAVRDKVASELDRLEACEPAARAIDLPRLRRLVENWPTQGWEREETVTAYRVALLRAISVGYFLRRSSGSNA